MYFVLCASDVGKTSILDYSIAVGNLHGLLRERGKADSFREFGGGRGGRLVAGSEWFAVKFGGYSEGRPQSKSASSSGSIASSRGSVAIKGSGALGKS